MVLVQSLQLFTRELLTGAETEAGSATLTRTLTPTLTPTPNPHPNPLPQPASPAPRPTLDGGLLQVRTLAAHFGLKEAASGAEAVVLKRGELRAPVVELDGRQREKPLPGMVSSLIEAKRAGVPVPRLPPCPPALSVQACNLRT